MNTANRGIASLVYTYFGTLIRTGIQFVVGVLLARLLTPEDFGVVAIAWIVVGFGSLVADAGLTQFIVQRKNISRNELGQIYWAQIIVGLVLTVSLLLLAWTLATLLGDIRSAPILQAMAAIFVLRAIGQTSYGLLARGGRFDLIQLISVASYLLSYGALGVPMAIAGFGAWAIAAAAISQVALGSLFQTIAAPPTLSIDSFRPKANMFLFSAKSMTAGYMGLLLYNVDNISISHSMGSYHLGIYNRSMTLVNLPIQVINQVNSVILSFASKVQDRRSISSQIYLSMNTIYSMTAIPALLVVAAFPQETILGLYGPNWLDAAPVVRALAIAIAFNALAIPCGAVLMSIDRTDLEIRGTLAALIFICALAAVARGLTLEMFAWGIALAYLARLLIHMFYISQELGVAKTKIIGSAIVPALSTSVAPVLAAYLSTLVTESGSAEATLLAIIAAAAIGLGISLLLLAPWLSRGPVADLLVRTHNLPALVYRWLRISKNPVIE